MEGAIKPGEPFVAFKAGITFDFLNLEHNGILTIGTLMSFPAQLLKQGQVNIGIKLANMYKSYFDRIRNEAELPVLPDHQNASIGRNDWIRGAVRVAKSKWYQEEFVPTVADIYFQTLDIDNDNNISFDEWRRLYRLRGIDDDEFCRRTFTIMDEDGDFVISKEEFQNAFLQYGLGEDPNVNYSFLYATTASKI